MNPAPLPSIDTSSRPSRLAARAWLLMLVDGLERADAAPIANPSLHRLAYLANCLAPVYDLPAPDGKIMKYRRGPFYPALQWDIDRLVAQGLLAMMGFRHVRDKLGPWFHASYALSDQAFRLIAALTIAPQAARMHAYLQEVTLAYANLPELGRENAALEDATYSDPEVHLNSLIDFGEWEKRNFTVKTADAFARLSPPGISLTGRDKLHLYFRYLNRMLERTAG